jgi:hypothetical protein
MANNKSFIALIFVFCLNLISTNIYAANVGGWTLGGGVAQGASTVYEGTKKVVIDGVDYIKKGTAKITPPASGVAKVLARGAAGYALSVAVEQLLGSVDWVLDPANNQIKYTDPNTANPDAFPKVWVVNGIMVTAGASPQAACSNAYKYYSKPTSGMTYQTANTDGFSWYCPSPQFGSSSRGAYISQVANPNYDPDAQEQEQKTLPLDVVAAQVISNAEGGDVNAQAATTAAAADIVAEAEKDDVKARPIAQQLESSATTKPADEAAAEKANEAQGQSKPNTQNPEAMDLSLEFPVFCGWAPLVCEAAQVVISFPQTLTNWWETGKSKAEEWALSISEAWTSVKEWATKENESEDTEVDIEELDLEAESVDINLASGCPAPVVFIDSDFYGQPFKIEFSFDGFCSILSDWVRPILISLGAFIAALILGGVKVNE